MECGREVAISLGGVFGNLLLLYILQPPPIRDDRRFHYFTSFFTLLLSLVPVHVSRGLHRLYPSAPAYGYFSFSVYVVTFYYYTVGSPDVSRPFPDVSVSYKRLRYWAFVTRGQTSPSVLIPYSPFFHMTTVRIGRGFFFLPFECHQFLFVTDRVSRKRDRTGRRVA